MERKTSDKGVSSFQALMIATASRVGTGNMAGVATAIVVGGPGAAFWMWLMAILGSASAFAESTLATKRKTSYTVYAQKTVNDVLVNATENEHNFYSDFA